MFLCSRFIFQAIINVNEKKGYYLFSTKFLAKLFLCIFIFYRAFEGVFSCISRPKFLFRQTISK